MDTANQGTRATMSSHLFVHRLTMLVGTGKQSLILTVKWSLFWLALLAAALVAVACFFCLPATWDTAPRQPDQMPVSAFGQQDPDDADREFVKAKVLPLLQSGAIGQDTLNAQLDALKRDSSVELIIVEQGGRIAYSSRPEVAAGEYFSAWDAGSGLNLGTMISQAERTGVASYRTVFQPVKSWKPGSRKCTIEQVAGTPLFAITLREQNAVPPPKKSTPTQPLLPGLFKTPLVARSVIASVTGLLTFCLFWLIGRNLVSNMTELCLNSALRTSEALTRSLNSGKPEGRASVQCAEFAVLNEILFDNKHPFLSRGNKELFYKRGEKIARGVLNSMITAVALIDRHGRILWSNRRATQIFETKLHSPRPMLLPELVYPGEPQDRFTLPILMAWEGNAQHFEAYCCRIVSRSVFPVEVFAQKLLLPNAECVCLSLIDISRFREAL